MSEGLNKFKKKRERKRCVIVCVHFIVYYSSEFLSSHTHTYTLSLSLSLSLQSLEKEVSLLLLHCYSYRTLPGALTQWPVLHH